jgi:ketosteroid isomerase-like protein
MKRALTCLALVLAACNGSSRAVRDSSVVVSSTASESRPSLITPEVRARVEDSVRAFIARGDSAVARRDVDAVVAEQADSSGMAQNGTYRIYTPDSVRKGFAYLKRIRSASISERVQRIDVLAPDAAAFTTLFEFIAVDSAGKAHPARGVWTAILAQRGGRFVALQEHQSYEPERAVRDST